MSHYQQSALYAYTGETTIIVRVTAFLAVSYMARTQQLYTRPLCHYGNGRTHRTSSLSRPLSIFGTRGRLQTTPPTKLLMTGGTTNAKTGKYPSIVRASLRQGYSCARRLSLWTILAS